MSKAKDELINLRLHSLAEEFVYKKCCEYIKELEKQNEEMLDAVSRLVEQNLILHENCKKMKKVLQQILNSDITRIYFWAKDMIEDVL